MVKNNYVILLILILCSFSLGIVVRASLYMYKDIEQVASTLKVHAAASKPLATLREKIDVFGNLTLDGELVNGFVSIEIVDSVNRPIIYRTVATGDLPSNAIINILSVTPSDLYGNPKSAFELGEVAYFYVQLKNIDTAERSVLVTINLFDRILTPLGMRSVYLSKLSPGEVSTIIFNLEIPKWSYIGGAKAVVNVFSNLPRLGGIPYCPEHYATFNITRGPGTIVTDSPILNNPSPDGWFNISFRLSPEPINGSYVIYASGNYQLLKATYSTTFEVQLEPTPPQASFTYTPATPYVNQTVNFDASASTAEGYKDEIVSYEWNFGDGNFEVTNSSLITHTFTQPGYYIVTLNVTDGEGLWCITAKPVYIKPPTGPTADFMWYPSTPSPNQSVTFDASLSLPGWNGTGEAPIILYRWDFGDGNITEVSTPIVTHVYTAEGNYTVTLTVYDTQGLQDSKTQIIRVRLTSIPGDVNGDGIVDIYDAIIFSYAFGSTPEDPNWNPNCDLNDDQTIDIYDAIILAEHFGETAG